MSDPVLVSLEEGVAIVTLNAPERRNAVSTAMRLQLIEVLDALFLDTACGAIVLTGAGGTFCAGGDIREMQTASVETPPDGSRLKLMHEVVRRIAFGVKPVVAAVEGSAAGAGISLAVACDCLITASNARFMPSFARMGLIADTGLLWSLPRRVGPVTALDLLMSCRPIDGTEALSIGLADHSTEPGQACQRAVEQAQSYIRGAPLALAALREHLKGPQSNLDTLLETELAVQAQLRASADHREARAAFLDKRNALFRGE